MIRNLILATAALGFVMVAVPKASASTPPVFDLNVDFCGNACLSAGGSGGTVTLTQLTGAVEVVVSLNSPLIFHDQGLTSFAFNNTLALVAGDITINNGGGTTWGALQIPSTNSDGAGQMGYGLSCPAGANGCPGPSSFLDFTVTHTGITIASFETLVGAGGHTTVVDFAANVANSTTSGCTGIIGGGSGTSESTARRVGTTGTSGACSPSNPPVPEPTSVLLLGTGLLFAGKLLKAKLLV